MWAVEGVDGGRWEAEDGEVGELGALGALGALGRLVGGSVEDGPDQGGGGRGGVGGRGHRHRHRAGEGGCLWSSRDGSAVAREREDRYDDDEKPQKKKF